MTDSLLGAPLDKTETCGDWSARPLSESQVRYAAQDARVLVRLLPGLLAAAGVLSGDVVSGGGSSGSGGGGASGSDNGGGCGGTVSRGGARESAAAAAAAMAFPATAFIGDVVLLQGTTTTSSAVAGSSSSLSAALPFTSTPPSASSASPARAPPRAPPPLPPLSAGAVAATLQERLPCAGGDPTVIELAADTGPAAADTALSLGAHVSPHAVIKSIGVMVSIAAGGALGDAAASGLGGTLNTVAAALGGGGGAGAAGACGGKRAKTGGSSRSAEPVMLLLRGTDRVDLKAVGAHFGLARRHVRLATPEECISVFGYPPGSMPPFGHRRECVTLLASGRRPSTHTFTCKSQAATSTGL